MKSSVLLLAMVGLLSTQAQAASYVKHVKIKGQNAQHGSYDIDYVQLIARPGRALTAADIEINKKIALEAKELICDTDTQEPSENANSESSQESKVTFVSDRLLSIEDSVSVSCAGTAHPDYGVSSTIYDRKTGKEIDIRTDLPVSYDGEESASMKKINAVITQAMFAQAKIEKKERGDSDCDERYTLEALSELYPSHMSVSPKALVVENSTSHVDAVCTFSTSIPLKKFIGVAPKGSLLDQLAQGSLKLK